MKQKTIKPKQKQTQNNHNKKQINIKKQKYCKNLNN